MLKKEGGGAILILICKYAKEISYDYFPQYIILADLAGVARRVLLHVHVCTVKYCCYTPIRVYAPFNLQYMPLLYIICVNIVHVADDLIRKDVY